MAYLSTADINAYLGTSGEDTLIATINSGAEAILNNLIGVDTLEQANYTELYDYPVFLGQNGYITGRVFYLNQVNPTAITSIDGDSLTINVDYIIEGRKITLKDSVSQNLDFPYKNTIVYTAGYSTIPNDIKQAMYLVVGALYNMKNAQGIKRFEQDLLTVEYWGNTAIDNLDSNNKNALQLIVNKYKPIKMYVSGIDRSSIRNP